MEAHTGSAAREAEEFAELLNARGGAPTEEEIEYLAELTERGMAEQRGAREALERDALAKEVASAIGADQDRRAAATQEHEAMLQAAREGDWSGYNRHLERQSAARQREEAAKPKKRYW